MDPLFWPPSRLDVVSAWYGHVPFGHWVVCNTKPRVLVELGTHCGVSYAAFCESVLRLRLPTACFAVNTWKGDEQAGFYGEEVYESLRHFNSSRYAPFSELLRTTFDEALSYFADNSIDLLHIDGFHTYEAVKHDFEAWLPKLSERAVVLLHDTNGRERSFGVWRLFLELKERWPTFEFLHSYGLGVVAVGSDAPNPVTALCTLNGDSINSVRERFAKMGERWEDRNRGTDTARRRLDELGQTVETLASALNDQQARADRFAAEVESLRTELCGFKAVEFKALESALEKEHARSTGLMAEIRSIRAELRWSKRQLFNWNEYDHAYHAWKEYKKNRIGRQEALEIIDARYGVRPFFRLYPLYKVIKPFRKLKKSLARRLSGEKKPNCDNRPSGPIFSLKGFCAWKKLPPVSPTDSYKKSTALSPRSSIESWGTTNT